MKNANDSDENLVVKLMSCFLFTEGLSLARRISWTSRMQLNHPQISSRKRLSLEIIYNSRKEPQICSTVIMYYIYTTYYIYIYTTYLYIYNICQSIYPKTIFSTHIHRFIDSQVVQMAMEGPIAKLQSLWPCWRIQLVHVKLDLLNNEPQKKTKTWRFDMNKHMIYIYIYVYIYIYLYEC